MAVIYMKEILYLFINYQLPWNMYYSIHWLMKNLKIIYKVNIALKVLM